MEDRLGLLLLKKRLPHKKLFLPRSCIIWWQRYPAAQHVRQYDLIQLIQICLMSYFTSHYWLCLYQKMKTPQRWRTSRVYVIVVLAILSLFDIILWRQLTDGRKHGNTERRTDGNTGPILLPRLLTREVKKCSISMDICKSRLYRSYSFSVDAEQTIPPCSNCKPLRMEHEFSRGDWLTFEKVARRNWLLHANNKYLPNTTI